LLLTSYNIVIFTLSYFSFNNKTIKIGNLLYLITKKKKILRCIVNYLEDNSNLENRNWRFIEKSEVNDKIISRLIKNLSLDMSDDFFLSFESLLKIGERAESNIKAVMDEIEERHKSKKEIFNMLLSCIKENILSDSIIHQIYHPDFLVRAKAIFKIEERGDLRYLKYILPLLEDPDDSVRWALIKLLMNLNQVKIPFINKKLNQHFIKESNPIIKEKMAMILKKN